MDCSLVAIEITQDLPDPVGLQLREYAVEICCFPLPELELFQGTRMPPLALR